MTDTDDTVRVFIPLTFRRRNGRPKILPPEPEPGFQARSQDLHILRALGRAWAWRRRLESGEAATIQDIARAENVSDRFVSRIIRLAYPSGRLASVNSQEMASDLNADRYDPRNL